jgi:DNA invertase Pin-like site-specific DNA recombinase
MARTKTKPVKTGRRYANGYPRKDAEWVPEVDETTGKKTLKLIDHDDAELVRRRAASDQAAGKRVPYCFGYARLSTAFQAERHNTIEAQKDAIMGFYTAKLKESGFEWGGFFCDPSTSAGIPFLKRPAGRSLTRKLKRGDHVVAYDMARGFRSQLDMLQTMEKWESMGVTFHLTNCVVDLGTPIGRVIMGMLGSFAQFERESIALRRQEGVRRAVEQGFWPFGTKASNNLFVPYGFRAVDSRYRGKRMCRLVPDLEQRELASTVLTMRELGYSWTAITNQAPIYRGKKRPTDTLKKWAAKELELRAKEDEVRKRKEQQS